MLNVKFAQILSHRVEKHVANLFLVVAMVIRNFCIKIFEVSHSVTKSQVNRPPEHQCSIKKQAFFIAVAAAGRISSPTVVHSYSLQAHCLYT